MKNKIIDKIMELLTWALGLYCIAVAGYIILPISTDGVESSYNLLSNKVVNSKENFIKKVRYIEKGSDGNYSLTVQMQPQTEVTTANPETYVSLTPFGEKDSWNENYWRTQLTNYKVNAKSNTIDSQINPEYFTLMTENEQGIFRIVTLQNGKSFIYERQGRAKQWALYKPKGSTMKEAGCGFFAIAALATNELGRIFTVKDVVLAVGESLTVLDGAYIPAGQGYHLHHMSNPEHYNKLYIDTKTIRTAMNKFCEELGNGYTYKTKDIGTGVKFPNDCLDKLRTGAANYIVHDSGPDVKDSPMRSGTQHWTTIMGIALNDSGVECAIVLCNCDGEEYRGFLIPLSTFCDIKFNHIYEVVRE